MGHLGHLKEEFRELADRLGQGQTGLPEPKTEKAWEGWRVILEILYTPEETALADEPLPDVLDFERASRLIDEARAASLPNDPGPLLGPHGDAEPARPNLILGARSPHGEGFLSPAQPQRQDPLAARSCSGSKAQRALH